MANYDDADSQKIVNIFNFIEGSFSQQAAILGDRLCSAHFSPMWLSGRALDS